MAAIRSPSETLAWRRSRPGAGRLAVVTGTFDWIHPGTLWLLAAARRVAPEVLVIVEPAAVATAHAGAGHPQNTLETRVEMASHLRDVATVTSLAAERLAEFACELGAFTRVVAGGQRAGDAYGRALEGTGVCVETAPDLPGCFGPDLLAALREGRTPVRLPGAWGRVMGGGDAPAALPAGAPRVTVNGCFDILHIGHLRFLAAARAMGGSLTVLINDDASVARYKGPTRPVFPAAFRRAALKALACVDEAILFASDTPLEALARLKPDIHAKGGSFEPDRVGEERVLLERWGGRLATTPLLDGFSTTAYIRKALGS
jgi:rfaE bifunctional protein nucleotidyltransferase chain/domain